MKIREDGVSSQDLPESVKDINALLSEGRNIASNAAEHAGSLNGTEAHAYQHIYADLTDKELEMTSQISDEYLLTLCLAYIAEARWYLELEEFDTAIRRFKEGKEQINTRIEKYVDLLLTSKPLMYLHPKLKGKTDLSRLTRIYQWKDPSFTESSVFEILRNSLIPKHDMLWSFQINEWINSLPASVVERENVKKGLLGINKEGREEVIQKLPEVFTKMESMVETSQRFNAYEIEVKAISQLEMRFHEWLKLRPAEPQKQESNLMCILPKEPLDL